jgi:hypothetical protein
MSNEVKTRLSARVSVLLAECLHHFLNNLKAASEVKPPPDQAAAIEAMLAFPRRSYREAFVIQAAYGLLQPSLDLTLRQEGGRSVAQRFARLLKQSHIDATSDAFQNIGKNDANLCRGNVPEFDSLLRWASSAKPAELDAAFNYAMAGLARIAKPVASMPEPDVPMLSFYRVANFLDELLDRPSGGAHDQFATAAFLELLIDEVGATGLAGLRVTTKHLHASDASARTAGDVEIRHGGRVEEILEISANDWRTKLDQARLALRTADLPRAHVVARVGERLVELSDLTEDISILDAGSFLRVLVAALSKPARSRALVRLYELLDRNQPNVELVNAYVELLKQHGLAR